MSILNHFIEANICLVVFYGLYRIFLHNETSFGFNRIFLLSAGALPVVMPFLDLGTLGTIPAVGNIVPAYLLPEMTVAGNPATAVDPAGGITLWPMARLCYFVVAGFLMLRLLYRCAGLLMIIRAAPLYAEMQGVRILAIAEPAIAFSVFRYIIIGNPASLAENERQVIIRHEMVHVRRRHTWDIMLAELLCAVFWLNPVTFKIKKSLRDVHEFQADREASEGGDTREYCSLLAKICLQSSGLGLANHFNKSLTIKRINMMKTVKRKISRWKFAVLAAAVSGVSTFVACQDQVMSDLNTVATHSSVALDVPRHVQDRYDRLSAENPGSRYVIVEVQDGGLAKVNEMESQYGRMKSFEIVRTGAQPATIAGNPSVNGSPATDIPVVLEKGSGSNARTFAIVEFTDEVRALSQTAVQEGEVFLIVEETAFPKEGMEKLYAFLAENMSYPTGAKEAGITGRVFIEFIVEKDGTLTNFKSLKGIGHGCDDEAIRVLALSPPWNPGKQQGQPVRQKMVMPVVFDL